MIPQDMKIKPCEALCPQCGSPSDIYHLGDHAHPFLCDACAAKLRTTCAQCNERPARFVLCNDQPHALPCRQCLDEQRREAEALATAERHAALDRTLRANGMSQREITQTFETFEVYDPRQEKVLEACRNYRPDAARNWLLLLGSPGSSKGHLLNGILHEHSQNFYAATQFEVLVRYRQLAYGFEGNEADALDWFRDLHILAIQDAGVKPPTPVEQATMTEILDLRYRHGGATLISANLSPNEIREVFGERFVDRLYEVGMLFDNQPFIPCTWQSYRMKRLAEDRKP